MPPKLNLRDVSQTAIAKNAPPLPGTIQQFATGNRARPGAAPKPPRSWPSSNGPAALRSANCRRPPAGSLTRCAASSALRSKQKWACPSIPSNLPTAPAPIAFPPSNPLMPPRLTQDWRPLFLTAESSDARSNPRIGKTSMPQTSLLDGAEWRAFRLFLIDLDDGEFDRTDREHRREVA